MTLGSVIAAGGFRAWLQHERREQDRADLAGGVDLYERWNLGQLPQWVRIRGRDSSKPLLLWIHGGPGFPQTPFAAAVRELERDFVVIHWDQRGAGRTYRENRSAPNMRLEQFVDDAHALLVTALRRFDRRKCVLVAHSWGSIVGAMVASRYPELVSVYIGVGQLSSYQASEQFRYDGALTAAARAGDQVAIKALRQVGPPPHRNMDDCKVIDRWFDKLVPREVTPVSPWVFVRLAFASPDYTWLDLLAIPRGVRYSSDALWREIYYEIDLARTAVRIEVPVHLIAGEGDRIAPLVVAQKYLSSLAPGHARELHRFPRSTHWAFLEEEAKFGHLVRELGSQKPQADSRSQTGLGPFGVNTPSRDPAPLR